MVKQCFFLITAFVCVCVALQSCSEAKRTTVKNYRANLPFVFSNKIQITGVSKKDERKRLEKQLTNYWDDSLQVPKIQQFGILYRIKNPYAFDTVNISRSKALMEGYLESQGYYTSNASAVFKIDTFKNQLRTYVTMNIDVGKSTLIDSVGMAFTDTTIQQLVTAEPKAVSLKPGMRFSKEVVSAELDRIVQLLRQKGYMRITRENFYAEVDTLEADLLNLTIDPFVQAQKIAEATQKRALQPTISVVLKQREINDSSLLKDSSSLHRFIVGKQHYYPEAIFGEVPDSVIIQKTLFTEKINNKMVHFNERIFNLKTFGGRRFLRQGEFYNEQEYIRTLNNYNQIGAWQQVDGRTTTRNDTVDIHLVMTPALRQGFNFEVEASRNTGDFLGSNLIGISLNMGYKNRNFGKRAIQMNTLLRNGVEFAFRGNGNVTENFVQTIQTSLTHNFVFPKFVAPFTIKSFPGIDNIRTIAGLGYAYTDRRQFYVLSVATANWGYEWRVKNKIWKYTPLNIEVYNLDTLQLLRDAFQSNPFLRTAFNTGSVVSQNLSLTINTTSKRNPNINHFKRIFIEEAGTLAGIVPTVRRQIYRYLKLEAEYRQRIVLTPKTSIAFRAMAGIGYNYNRLAGKDSSLPFFKQFVAGGPNSMRAWGLRQLGLGSSLLSDTSSTFRDRFGDVQLEFNAEYRFTVANIGGLKLGSAFFIDAGNIWNLKRTEGNPTAEFNLNRLYQDLAIAMGTSVRLDFDYFLIRVDFGYKVKDPARQANNGWMSIKNFTWQNYEFAEPTRPVRNNFAFQLGIGLPF